MDEEVSKDDLENLSAWVDGELDERQAADVERAVRAGGAMGRARREMQALDRLLDRYDVPEPPADLAERIIDNVRSARRAPRVVRLARWLVPAAAAAAAIVVAAVLLSGPRQEPDGPIAGPVGPAEQLTTAKVLASATPEEQRLLAEDFAAENLDMLRNYDVLVLWDTLEEIEKIEAADSGT
jgi:hypothetical protein